MNIEKKRMESFFDERCGHVGHITLDKLAIPESVKVTLFGEPIIPASFDCYGHPNFTKEQEELYSFKQYELKRYNGGNYIPLKVEIVYEERIFDVPRSTFDTVEGIEKSLLNLSDLNEMLQNRKIFCFANKSEQLNEFVLFGCYLLDESGNICPIEKSGNENLETNGDVEDFETVRGNNKGEFTVTLKSDVIPSPGSVCPCCGKMLTLDDVKNNLCTFVHGKFYHDSCWRNYRRLTEVDRFTHDLMDYVYMNSDYQVELLPNGYCNCDHCSHVPWFLFHTIDGDIIMGWRNSVISIEWQENYKPFDMNELFGTEDVTKWQKGGKRGIHASNDDMAVKYLKKVLKAVNPGYSRW